MASFHFAEFQLAKFQLLVGGWLVIGLGSGIALWIGMGSGLKFGQLKFGKMKMNQNNNTTNYLTSI